MTGRQPRVLIVGVGLIGGSFALALKQVGQVESVTGLGRSSLSDALRLGVVDAVANDLASGAAEADIILLATPVGQMPQIFGALRGALLPHALVTDAGSTKQDVVAAARAGLGERIGQFIPAHPIAGREKSGVTAAEASLYVDRQVVLTPLPENREEDVARIASLWQACGARVQQLSPATHDAVFAAVSHLPHMLAYALVDDIARRPNADELFSFAAGGFRDFTRIASSSPEMWRDIALNNRAALLGEIDAYAASLARLRALVEAGDGPAIEALMHAARERRDAWLAAFNAGKKSTAE
jgi:prephenate dehydrogenase